MAVVFVITLGTCEPCDYFIVSCLRYRFLFGRIKTSSTDINQTESVCVVIDSIDYNLFILPRAFKLSDRNDETSVTEEEVRPYYMPYVCAFLVFVFLFYALVLCVIV